MKNITLANVKDFAFLAKKAYVSKTEIKNEQQSNKDLGNNYAVYNPATNSSFEVIDQTNEKSKIFGVDTSGFSATVFKDTNTNEYVIAFRGSDDMQDFRDDLIMGATSTGLLGDAKISITGHSLGVALA